MQGLTFNSKDVMWMICKVTRGMSYMTGACRVSFPCNAKNIGECKI
jgi:hypothetical protein